MNRISLPQLLWRFGLILTSQFVAFGTYAHVAKSVNSAFASDRCELVVDPLAYEKHLMATLTGVKSFLFEGKEVFIRDRSVSLMPNEHHVAIEFISHELRRLGVAPTYQISSVMPQRKWYRSFPEQWDLGFERANRNRIEKPMVLERTNIVVDIPSEDPNAQILIFSAHYDTANAYGKADAEKYFFSPGADDNGSGVVALFRMIKKALAQNTKPQFHLRFIFFDSEEATVLHGLDNHPNKGLGTNGSRAYVSQLTGGELQKIALSVNIDMIGSGPGRSPYPQFPAGYGFCFTGIVGSVLRTKLSETIKGSPLPLVGIARNDKNFFANHTDNRNFGRMGIPTFTLSNVLDLKKMGPHINNVTDTCDVIQWRDYAHVLSFLSNFVLKLGF